MEFKDRVPRYPGRVKLTPVSGQANVYDMTLQDNASVAGTPLNAATFDALKQDLIDYVNENPGPQGEKGDKGDSGSVIDKKTIIVGSNESNSAGWYKVGSVTFPQNEVFVDYHAKILITCTYERALGVNMPSGLLTVDIRYADTYWENCYVKWLHCSGINPEYICYTLIDKTFTLYAYIPEQHDFYRMDILGESNRDGYRMLFEPIVNYGGVSQNRYGTVAPAAAKYPMRSYTRFYVWEHFQQVNEDMVISLSKSMHGLNRVKGAIVIPKSNTTGGNLSGYDNFATGNLKYGVLIANDTVYFALDVGTLKEGFYGLVYGD